MSSTSFTGRIDLLSALRPHAWLVGLTASFLTIGMALYRAVDPVRPFVLALSAIITIWGAKAVIEWGRLNARPPFPRGAVFPGLKNAEAYRPGELFSRRADLESLLARIRNHASSNKILAVAGDSGTGKSVLVRMAARRIGKEHACVTNLAKSPPELKVALLDALRWIEVHEHDLSSADPSTIFVLVLDQFEHLLDEVTRRLPDTRLGEIVTTGGDVELIASLRQLFSYKRTFKALRVLAVVRSDRFYDLRLLQTLGQIPYDAFEVLGLTSSAGLPEFIDRLVDIGFTPSSASKIASKLSEADGTLLPVKAQMAGSILESRLRTNSRGVITKYLRPLSEEPVPRLNTITDDLVDSWGGPHKLIELYFRQVVDSSKYPRIAEEVLYVLASEGRVRRRWDLGTLSKITLRPENQVWSTLEWLQEQHLVTVAGGYALVHDYLARTYRKLSGRILEPTVRDNLTSSFDNRATITATDDYGDESPALAWIARSVMLALFVFFCYRLLNFQWFPVVGNYNRGSSATWSLDWYYLPLVLVQGCWAFYATEMTANIFARIDTRRRERSLSYSVLAVVAVGGVLTAFAPAAWLFFVGISGVFVGIKYLYAGRRVRHSTGLRRNAFTGVGLYCTAMNLIAVYGGYFMYRNWPALQVRPEGWRDVAYQLMADPIASLSSAAAYYTIVLLLLVFPYLYRRHVIADRAVEFTGLYMRTLDSN